jgi:putative peptide-modifying radical SAM enzyme
MEDVDEGLSGFHIDYSLPRRISYVVHCLEKLVRRDPFCVLTFYGGEPLLCMDDMKRIMDRVEARHFMVQTNGLLLDNLEAEYVNRFHTVLVSLDGGEGLTDYYRGKGTYRKVVDNLRLIRRNGFRGELVARMTVMEQTDIYRQVRRLLDNDEFRFSSVHWQLNAGFWTNDFSKRDFKRWSVESYVPGVRKLAEFWVSSMEKKGVVLRLYPLLGVAHSLLFGERNCLLRCGGGWINYAVQTDGYVIPCPTMWGMKDFYLGNVCDVDPFMLGRVFVGKPCSDCDILGVCGGRCLYAVLTKRWGPEAYGLVCDTVRKLVEAVSRQVPRIWRLIDKGRVSLSDFEYMRYNGCEIIP